MKPTKVKQLGTKKVELRPRDQLEQRQARRFSVFGDDDDEQDGNGVAELVIAADVLEDAVERIDGGVTDEESEDLTALDDGETKEDEDAAVAADDAEDDGATVLSPLVVYYRI